MGIRPQQLIKGVVYWLMVSLCQNTWYHLSTFMLLACFSSIMFRLVHHHLNEYSVVKPKFAWWALNTAMVRMESRWWQWWGRLSCFPPTHSDLIERLVGNTWEWARAANGLNQLASHGGHKKMTLELPVKTWSKAGVWRLASMKITSNGGCKKGVLGLGEAMSGLQ